MGVADPLRNRSRRRRRVFAVERLEPRTVLSALTGFPAIGNTGVAPPDPDAAAGPASLIAVVAGQIQIQTKTGITIASGPLEGSATARGFFDSVDHQIGAPLVSVYDPRVLFDPYSQRFFAIAAETQSSATDRGIAGGTQSYVLVAVSTTSTPTDLDLTPGDHSDWLFYSVPVTQSYANSNGTSGLAWIDQPEIAADSNSLYVVGNYINFGNSSQQQFQNDVVTRIDKNALLSGAFNPSNPSQRIDRVATGASVPQKAFALRPVQSTGLPPGTPEVFADALSLYSQDTKSGSGSGIRFWVMDPSTFVLQEVATISASYSFNITAGAPQAGSSLNISLRTDDGRLSNAVLQNGTIWTSQTILAPNGATNVRWLQIAITSQGFVLSQSGLISPGPGIDTFVPAVAVDAQGDLGIVYTQSSSSQFPTLMFSGRRFSDPGGVLQPGAVIKASNGPYIVSGFSGTTQTRLGGTTAITVDPSDLATFWTFGEYGQDSKNWGTWFGAETFATTPIPGDYNGDGKTDIAVFQPSSATWFIFAPLPSSPGVRVIQFGQPFGDIPVPADYDGDGKTDLAVYRPSTAQWFIIGSTAGPRVVSFGQADVDIPVPADYDGDHKADVAVYRPTTGAWFFLQSTAGPKTLFFGGPNTDQPVPADYDGDGKVDLGVFRPSIGEWFLRQSTAGPKQIQFGPGGFQSTPVPADYDGDGKADLAVSLGATASWAILDSSTNQPDSNSIVFGTPVYFSIPVPGSYDVASQADLAVYVPRLGQWFFYNTATKTSRAFAFGSATHG
jgi:FG-GAP-like repeat/FG-GAP repeat